MALDPWISSLLTTLVGWVLGVLSAFSLETYRSIRRRKALAGALLAEVHRIYSELFFIDSELTQIRLGSPQMSTSVHPWVQKIVIDSAEIGPSIVQDFLRLDLNLCNLTYLKEKRSALENCEDNRTQCANLDSLLSEVYERVDFDLATLENCLRRYVPEVSPMILRSRNRSDSQVKD